MSVAGHTLLIFVCFKFQKADKRALENKVNHKLFDQTTDEINKMIKEILDKLAGHVSQLPLDHHHLQQFSANDVFKYC